jgi:ABC-type antimicrobial peptide transport system permease subunit
MLVAATFAVSALFLACLGVYGAIAYTVACRTNEMGLRMALGAKPSNVAGLVLRQGMVPVAGGLAVGIAAALWAGHFLNRLVFQVNARDPATIAVVAVALATAAAAACWMPARRASRIDPSLTLRQE